MTRQDRTGRVTGQDKGGQDRTGQGAWQDGGTRENLQRHSYEGRLFNVSLASTSTPRLAEAWLMVLLQEKKGQEG